MSWQTTLAQTTSTSGGDRSIDLNPVEQLFATLESMLETAVSVLPKIALAAAVVTVAWLVARTVRRIARPRLASARTESFGRVFATLIYAGIITVGFIVAIPIAFPSVDVAAMLGGLGLLGVAAGFAFQDILSNLLSGVLLILRQPFVGGDQIEVNGVKGTVAAITIRETQITTFDGRVVYVPNADVYSNAIEVQTANDTVRTSLLVGVDYDTDLPQARDTALAALAEIDGILDDPEPQAYYTEFGASSITLDLRYWTASRQADIRSAQDRVVETIKARFDDAGIGIPFDIVTLEAGKTLEGRGLVGAGSSNGKA